MAPHEGTFPHSTPTVSIRSVKRITEAIAQAAFFELIVIVRGRLTPFDDSHVAGRTFNNLKWFTNLWNEVIKGLATHLTTILIEAETSAANISCASNHGPRWLININDMVNGSQ